VDCPRRLPRGVAPPWLSNLEVPEEYEGNEEEEEEEDVEQQFTLSLLSCC